MKNKYVISFLITIASINLCSAQVKTFVIKPEQTSKILPQYTNVFSVNTVIKDKIEVPKFKEVYVLTERFQNQMAKIEQLVKDSIEIIENHEKEIVIYEKKLEFIKKIDEFMESQLKFKEKKHILRDAQAISDEIKFGYNIFSEKTKNVSSDQLAPIKENAIQRAPKPVLSYNAKETFKNLAEARNYLNSIEQFERKFEDSGTETIDSYVSTGEVSDFVQLNGKYDYVYEDQFLITTDHAQFTSGQIVGDSVLNIPTFNKRYAQKGILFFNQQASEYYFDTGRINFFFTCGTNNEVNDFAEKLSSLGYNIQNSADGSIIIINNIELKIKPDIYENVSNGNTDYPKKLANSIVEFKKYMQDAKVRIQSLANHFSAYTGGTLTTSRLNNWKADLMDAQKLEKEFRALPGAERKNWSYFMDQLDNETINTFSEFTKVLRGSEVILGL